MKHCFCTEFDLRLALSTVDGADTFWWESPWRRILATLYTGSVYIWNYITQVCQSQRISQLNAQTSYQFVIINGPFSTTGVWTACAEQLVFFEPHAQIDITIRDVSVLLNSIAH